MKSTLEKWYIGTKTAKMKREKSPLAYFDEDNYRSK